MQTKLFGTDLSKNKIINSFKEDFLAIKNKGLVLSHRKHDTGIGKTFEDLINVYENNNKLPDYKNVLELKSQRELSKSMITIFTLVPTSPKKVMSHIRDTYGTQDIEFPNRKIIHTTVPHSKYNSYKGLYGFKLDLDEAKRKLFLRIKNLKTNKDENIEIFWELEELRKSVKIKCDYIAYIKAKREKEEGGDEERFHFIHATILSGLTFKKFLELIKKDVIVFDIRFGVYRSGSKRGQSHDHGPAFRIAKRNLNKAFEITEV